jgi:hypothetical protein
MPGHAGPGVSLPSREHPVDPGAGRSSDDDRYCSRWLGGIEGARGEPWTHPDPAAGRRAGMPADDLVLDRRLGGAHRRAQPAGALAARSDQLSTCGNDRRHEHADQNKAAGPEVGVRHRGGAGCRLGLGASCPSGRRARHDFPDQQATAARRRLGAALQPRAAGRPAAASTSHGRLTGRYRPGSSLAIWWLSGGRGVECASSAAACPSRWAWDCFPWAA